MEAADPGAWGLWHPAGTRTKPGRMGPLLAPLKVPGVGTAPTMERELRAPAGTLQESQEEGPEHLGAPVVGGEDVEQPPALLAAVPAGKIWS